MPAGPLPPPLRFWTHLERNFALCRSLPSFYTLRASGSTRSSGSNLGVPYRSKGLAPQTFPHSAMTRNKLTLDRFQQRTIASIQKYT